MEHTFCHVNTTKDARLFGHHFGAAVGCGWNTGKGGVVAVAYVLAKCRGNQSLEPFRKKAIVKVRHN